MCRTSTCDCGRGVHSSGVAAPVRDASRHLPLLPALAVVLLPKCPLCVAAYLGILGSLGVGSWLRDVWGLALGAGLLAFTIGALALRALRKRRIHRLLVGVCGATAVLGGKFFVEAPLLPYAGAAALAFASIWSVRLS